jgi:hypothetical protein
VVPFDPIHASKTEVEEDKMRLEEIRGIAKKMGIAAYRIKKTDLVRTIQREEHNIECYGTKRVDVCQEPSCLWRSDCLSLNNR